jgi:hypothetical protein
MERIIFRILAILLRIGMYSSTVGVNLSKILLFDSLYSSIDNLKDNSFANKFIYDNKISHLKVNTDNYFSVKWF